MRHLNTLLFFIFFLYVQSLATQNNATYNSKLNNAIPINPTVKIGTLKNGLTYYLKHNAKPENKAALRLVVKAGSVLEDDDQQGLAHFLEHMAFNGTKNFPKNKLVDYLQSIGVEFGADLNAHTSFDETVYKLSVPTDSKTLHESLQVLRDWADGITFDHQEIDNERGVVAEELRARNGAGMRMYYQSIPVLTNNSRYATRSPIGKLDVVLNSEYDAMKRFYKDWYRPDLMALVLVGDFDVNKVEKKIKKLFNDIKPVKNPKERIYYTIPENEKPTVSLITDKEARGVSISLYHKKQKDDVTTLKDYKQQLLQKLYTGMLRQRLTEKKELPNTPFLTATAGIGKFLGNMDAYFLRAKLKEDAIEQGIEALLEESERAKRHGFTASELDRYKSLLLQNANTFQKETGKISNSYYIKKYVTHFTSNEPLPGNAFIYEFYKEVLPTITVNDVNEIGTQWIRDNNITIVMNAIEKEDLKLPTENELLTLLANSKTKVLQPYEDSITHKELMTKKPKAGKIITTEYHKKTDVTTWKLANGITVITKPTNYSNNLISMSGFRLGGSSIAPDSLYVSARYAGSIMAENGINDISNSDLKKLNMGKTVKVSPYINFYDEGISGISASEELERMLQMTHLYFTSPNKDKELFNSAKDGLKATHKDQEKSPSVFFEKKKSEIMTQNHLRGIPLSTAQIEKELNLNDAYNFYKSRFTSANGFAFFFVGNFEIDVLKKYTTEYLGSLPSNLEEKSSWKDIGLRRPKGVIKRTIVKGVDDKSQVTMNFTGEIPFSLEKKKQVSLLAKLLKIKLTEEMREKMGGVYGVNLSGFASDKPNDWYRMSIQFTCAPENVTKLIQKVFEEINKIKNNGASKVDIQKIKEAELANAKDNFKNNKYWMYKLKNVYEYNLEYESILKYKKSIKKINSTYFKEAANTYFNTNNYVELILMPEK